MTTKQKIAYRTMCFQKLLEAQPLDVASAKELLESIHALERTLEIEQLHARIDEQSEKIETLAAEVEWLRNRQM